MLPLARSVATTTLKRTYNPNSLRWSRKLNNMASATATPYQVHITPQNTGLWECKQTEEAAKKVSDLLQTDLEEHHVFFNNDGFHNHIPHHILALYGTGADANAIQKGYDGNTGYQRPVMPAHDSVIQELESWDHAKNYLGQEKYYPDFLRFFQKEIEKDGWENVLKEYVFKGDEAADDFFARLFAGFVHPLIQLMYGMEWAQPAIVAEALAQTCVHRNDVKSFLLDAEKEAKSLSGDMPSIWSLYETVKADSTLASAVNMADSNKLRDGVLVRGRAEMLKIASRVKVKPEELEERTAEMYNAVVAMAAAAAFHPPKNPKFDFFLMHHVNSSPIIITINSQSWIPIEVKVRVLEWKIRMDLLQYASRGVTSLSLDGVKSYKPKVESGKTPTDVITRLHQLVDDDGHCIKLGRAAGIGQYISKKYEGKGRLPIEGDDVWMKIHHLVVDSVQTSGPTWVRTAGLDEAWDNVPDAKL